MIPNQTSKCPDFLTLSTLKLKRENKKYPKRKRANDLYENTQKKKKERKKFLTFLSIQDHYLEASLRTLS